MVGIRSSPRTIKPVSIRPTGDKGPATGNFSGKVRLANLNFDLAFFVKPDPKNAKGYLYGVRPVGKNGGRPTSDIARVDFLLHPTYSKPHRKTQGPRFEVSTFSFTKDAVPVTAWVHLKSDPGKVHSINLRLHPAKAPELVAVRITQP
jgi:hypothetical protein